MKTKLENKKLYFSVGLTIGITLALTVGVYALGFFGGSGQLPEEFIGFYKKSADQSQQIVELTDYVNNKIKEINELDLDGKKQEALSLIENASQANEKAREEALQLSGYLEALVNIIPKITSDENKITALQAIAIELQLVEEFVNYNKSLSGFLDTLSLAVATNSTESRLAVETQLDLVNDKSKKINYLNSQYLAKIAELGILGSD